MTFAGNLHVLCSHSRNNQSESYTNLSIHHSQWMEKFKHSMKTGKLHCLEWMYCYTVWKCVLTKKLLFRRCTQTCWHLRKKQKQKKRCKHSEINSLCTVIDTNKSIHGKFEWVVGLSEWEQERVSWLHYNLFKVALSKNTLHCLCEFSIRFFLPWVRVSS